MISKTSHLFIYLYIYISSIKKKLNHEERNKQNKKEKKTTKKIFSYNCKFFTSETAQKNFFLIIKPVGQTLM